MKSPQVFMAMALMLCWSFGCGASPVRHGARGTAQAAVTTETPTDAEINLRCHRILSHFLGKELEKSRALRKALDRAVFRREKIGTGSEATYLGQDFGATIDLDREMVVVFMDFSQRPHSHGDLPDTLDREKLEQAVVKRGGISMRQAVDVARRFVIEHGGPEVLEGLSGFRNLSGGGEPIYSIQWYQPPGDSNVRFGRRYISVEINPFSAGVYSYVRAEEPVSLPPKMSLEECRRLALKFLRDDGMKGVRLLGFWYRDVRMVDGTVRSMWYVDWTSDNARDSIQLPKVVGVHWQDVEVDALTGRVRYAPVDPRESWPWTEATGESAMPTAGRGRMTPVSSP